MKRKKMTVFILDIKPSKEYDRTITVFSRQYGLLRILAKGTRKLFSRRGFHIDLLNLSKMEVEENMRAMYLREISTMRPFSQLKKHPGHFAVACVIASFLRTVLPEDMKHEKIFLFTKKIFDWLDRNSGAVTAEESRDILQTYLLKSMRELGYLPDQIPKKRLGKTLALALENIHPQFTLRARRTLGIFSNLESTRSS